MAAGFIPPKLPRGVSGHGAYDNGLVEGHVLDIRCGFEPGIRRPAIGPLRGHEILYSVGFHIGDFLAFCITVDRYHNRRLRCPGPFQPNQIGATRAGLRTTLGDLLQIGTRLVRIDQATCIEAYYNGRTPITSFSVIRCATCMQTTIGHATPEASATMRRNQRPCAFYAFKPTNSG